MKSRTTERFRKMMQGLPERVRRQARESYRVFAHDPYHPSLHFKRVHPTRPIYSVRVGLDYRAVGVRSGEEIVWYWIGPHSEYDKMLP